MRRELYFKFLFAAMALGFLFVSAEAQSIGDRNRPNEGGNHVITGRVYLPNGKPAPGVRVSFSSPDIFGSSTTTDNDGVFTFSGLPGGNYQITVKGEGFQSESESLTIERFA